MASQYTPPHHHQCHQLLTIYLSSECQPEMLELPYQDTILAPHLWSTCGVHRALAYLRPEHQLLSRFTGWIWFVLTCVMTCKKIEDSIEAATINLQSICTILSARKQSQKMWQVNQHLQWGVQENLLQHNTLSYFHVTIFFNTTGPHTYHTKGMRTIEDTTTFD